MSNSRQIIRAGDRVVLVQRYEALAAGRCGTVRDPGPDEVLIRVAVAAVNPGDISMWRTLGGEALTAPFIPGLDAAGTVEALGEGVDRLSVGDSVMAVVNPRRPEGGAQAELIVVPAASVVDGCRGLRGRVVIAF